MNADIMFADRRRTVVESGSGALEVIVPDADAAVRWASHGYPNSLAKWHHHPQIEFHLIREGSGLMMVGDCVVPCRAGHVALIGSNLPHNWVSDVKPGERLARRDVLCHVRPQTVKALMACFPETARFNLVLRRAARAMVLSGESAQAAGALLEGMGDHDPARRVADLIELFGVFADAPETEASTVVTPGYDLELSSDTERTVNEAIAYVTENLAGEISLEEAARLVSMSPSAFSRFFKRAAGIGFSDFVRRLRIGRAKPPAGPTRIQLDQYRQGQTSAGHNGSRGGQDPGGMRVRQCVEFQPALSGRDGNDAVDVSKGSSEGGAETQ